MSGTAESGLASPRPKSSRKLGLSPARGFVLTMAAWAAISASAQVRDKLDKYDVQVHGYATQGFLYTTQNNIYTTRSSDVSARWTDAVVNVGAVLMPKMRVGAQARYFLFGKYSDGVSLDWAQVDYRANEYFGVRAGKVKTPSGLFNEVQDIDPAYIWSLLPPSVYPVSSRNSQLSHVGGVVYGSVRAGGRLGKLAYSGWGGRQKIGSNDGFFTTYKEEGFTVPDGFSGGDFGATVRWKTPLPGLLAGAADTWKNAWQTRLVYQNGNVILRGTGKIAAFNSPSYFLSYEHGKLAGAGEYARVAPVLLITSPGLPSSTTPVDNRNWYAMASYKVVSRLTAGLYFSEQVNHASQPTGPASYSKDWALAGRYDFNQYLYGKFEQHFIDGTAIGYDIDLNPNGLKPDTRLTIVKIGISF
jgi:hypothetical protein